MLAPGVLGAAGGGGLPMFPLGVCFAGMVALTLGTVWQKRTAAGADLRTNAVVQFLGAAAATAPVMALTEEGRFDANWEAWAALLWAVLGLSVGAISLLLLLIRCGAVAGVASLFRLVPPAVAVLALVLFGERLAPVQVLGMAVAAAGVAVAGRAGTTPRDARAAPAGGSQGRPRRPREGHRRRRVPSAWPVATLAAWRARCILPISKTP